MPGPAASHIHLRDWGLLVLLSLIWGGSYLFVGIAVKDLSPLNIVMARIVIAAATLLPLHLVLIGSLPRGRGPWLAIAGLSLFNNVIPFILITTGQTMITAGLASVINATTPLFGVAFLAVAGLEPLIRRKVIGIILGIMGVAVLKGGTLLGAGTQSIGILICLGAAASYGLASLWAKRMVKDLAPLSMATGQLLISSVIMVALVTSFGQPSQLLHASAPAWGAVLALALISTSLGYIIFFRIVQRSGPANVLLGMMMTPVSAIAMGALFLGERLEAREIAGAFVIVCALLIIDGRALQLLRPRDDTA
jgi:drug/metabolite transporter (DMT)-like permease